MYKRRIILFLALTQVALLVLVARLGYLQIVRGDYYRMQAEKTLRSTEVLPAMRGRILDRRGRILAADKPCFDFCLDYRFLTAQPDWVARRKRMIARGLDVSRDEAGRIYRRYAENTWALARRLAGGMDTDLDAQVAEIKRRVAAYRRAVGGKVREEQEAHPVVAGLDESAAARARERLAETVGASIRPGHQRYYPYGATACHIIGVTGRVNAEEVRRHNLTSDQADWLQRKRRNYLPWDMIGKTGIEKGREDVLRGRRGYRRLRMGQEVVEDAEAIAGRDVRLSIDIELQKALTARLKGTGKTGAAVALAVETGQVLAMVSTPVYDLNDYREDFQALAGDEVFLPLRNRAVATLYPPGSTFKPLIALAALHRGVITRGTRIHCRGYMHTPGAFRCHGSHGDIRVVNAIRVSCNVFFYTVAERLGAPAIVDWLTTLGFADPPGMGLPQERAGILPTRERIRRRYEAGLRDTPAYVPADARFLGIGQGLIGVTPVHLANAIAAVARGGTFLSPRLVVSPSRAQQEQRKIPMPASKARLVRQGMHAVANEPGGTAYRYFRGERLGFDVCGKTGTAEATPHRIDTNGNGRIDSHDQPVRWGDMAWFVGFAPYRDPQIAFAVVIEYVEGGGGANAAPVAIDLLRLCRKYGYIP